MIRANAPADQALVFEEFRQIGRADKQAEGTGLDLAVSRKFNELHGGTIGVTSEPGVGSTFWFTLLLAIHAAYHASRSLHNSRTESSPR